MQILLIFILIFKSEIMKHYLLMFFTIFLFSCKDDTNIKEFAKEYKLIDSSNYQYIMLKNGFLKTVRFFPETNDTSAIYFFNKSKLRDSIAYYYYKDGTLEATIKYENNPRIKYGTSYYKNGIIKRQTIIYKNKAAIGSDKWFYKNGKQRKILDYLLYKDSIQYLNNQRYFNKQGEIIRDSSYFIEILTNKDTISINDSIEVSFNIIMPNKVMIFAYKGSINNNFGKKLPLPSNVFQHKTFYFKPKHSGKNMIEVVFVIVYKPEDPNSKYSKTFLKKEIFVTKW